MSICVKRTLGALAVALLLPLMFGACNKKPALHSCKNDQDCHAQAGGPGGVCLMGKCQECAEDTDCTDLRQCVNNRCVSVCQADADCAEGHHCADNACTADCLSDANCQGDKVCARGRCMAQGMVNDPNALGDAGSCSNLSPIHFDFDRREIKPEYYGHMEKVAQCLQADPQVSLVIGGHTDERGTPSYNMALSEGRAKEAMMFLQTKKGIASFRMKTVSYGEQRPLVNESTEHAWQQNRRAEFMVENSR